MKQNSAETYNEIDEHDLDYDISGEAFRFIREKCGLTRRQVARFGGIRYLGTISAWERLPTLTLYQVKILYNCIIDEFGSSKYYVKYLDKYKKSKERGGR